LIVHSQYNKDSVSKKNQCYSSSCRYKYTAPSVVLGRECPSGSHVVYCGHCKTVVQCHMFTPSTLGRRPVNKYPVNTYAPLPICLNIFHLQCYVVATVNHI